MTEKIIIPIDNNKTVLPISDITGSTDDMATQMCKGCGDTKEVTEFPKSKTTKTGFAGKCKKCVNARSVLRRKNQKAGYSGSMRITGLPKITPGLVLTSWQQSVNTPYFIDYLNFNHNQIIPEFIKQGMINTRNSSLGDRDGWKHREYHAAISMGWKHNNSKDGADAYDKSGRPIELKINWASAENNYEGAFPFNGGGSFNDYNEKRLIRLYEQDYMMAIPFYVDSRLIAMCTFDACDPKFYKRLTDQLAKKTKRAGRVALTFSFTQWIGAQGFYWRVLPTVTDLMIYQNLLSVSIKNDIITAMDKAIDDPKNATVMRSNDSRINLLN